MLTSGNISDEPIAYLDGDARRRLSGIADAFLAHDRPVHTRTDGSVTRAFRGRQMVLRRSRGFVPEPVPLPRPLSRPVLACGAELKNTFCLAKLRGLSCRTTLATSKTTRTLRSFEEGSSHFERLLDVRPEVVAHDLHPEYLSTKYAVGLAGAQPVELVGVQHHHAHVASCLADNGRTGPVIGVAFDGLGFGTDATMWGGEFLVADRLSFERTGSFSPVAMPGGAAAVREPWRMAAVYPDLAFAGDPPGGLAVARDNPARWEQVLSLARSGTNSPLTSSAGRLFDAVSAALGIRYRVNYEGQAAVELEQLADPQEHRAYPCSVEEGEPFRLAGADLLRAAVEDLSAGVELPLIAARFHNGLAGAVVAGCERVRGRSGINQVALSGGVFQNVLLLGRVLDGLARQGFGVLVHSRVPPNDGGISLGRAGRRGRGAKSGRPVTRHQ